MFPSRLSISSLFSLPNNKKYGDKPVLLCGVALYIQLNLSMCSGHRFFSLSVSVLCYIHVYNICIYMYKAYAYIGIDTSDKASIVY